MRQSGENENHIRTIYNSAYLVSEQLINASECREFHLSTSLCKLRQILNKVCNLQGQSDTWTENVETCRAFHTFYY